MRAWLWVAELVVYFISSARCAPGSGLSNSDMFALLSMGRTRLWVAEIVFLAREDVEQRVEARRDVPAPRELAEVEGGVQGAVGWHRPDALVDPLWYTLLSAHGARVEGLNRLIVVPVAATNLRNGTTFVLVSG